MEDDAAAAALPTRCHRIVPSASSANFVSTSDNVDESRNVQEMFCEL